MKKEVMILTGAGQIGMAIARRMGLLILSAQNGEVLFYLSDAKIDGICHMFCRRITGIHTQITDIFPRKDYLVLCYVSYLYDTTIPRKVFYFSEPCCFFPCFLVIPERFFVVFLAFDSHIR